MATKNTKTASQRAQNSKTATIRHQLVFDADTTKRAEELAAANLRSFNNMMAWLINREWERLNKAA